MALNQANVQKFVDLQLSKGRSKEEIAGFLKKNNLPVPLSIERKKAFTGENDPGDNLLSAMGNVFSSEEVQGVANKLSGYQEKVQQTLENTPVTKQILGAAGWVGRQGGEVLGGGMGAIAQPIANVMEGRPLMENVFNNAGDVSAVGGQMGEDIGKRAPLNALIAGSGGSVLNTALAASDMIAGGGKIQEGQNIEGAVQITGGAMKMAGAAQTDKLLPFGVEKKIPYLKNLWPDPTAKAIQSRMNKPLQTGPRPTETMPGPGAQQNIQKEMERAAVEHLKDPNRTGSMQIANGKLERDYHVLKTMVSDHGKGIDDWLMDNNGKYEINGINKMQDAFQQAVYKFGMTVDDNGTLVPAPGRSASLADGDVKLLQNAWDQLGELSEKDSPLHYKDIVRSLQNMVKYSKRGLIDTPDSPAEGFVKQVAGGMNDALYEHVGGDFKDVNLSYGALKDLRDYFGSALKERGKGGESLLFRALNGKANTDEILQLNRLSAITQNRGEPSLLDHALMAVKAMEKAGDPNAKSMMQTLMRLVQMRGGVPRILR